MDETSNWGFTIHCCKQESGQENYGLMKSVGYVLWSHRSPRIMSYYVGLDYKEGRFPLVCGADREGKRLCDVS